MPVKITAASVIHPLQLKVTLQVGNHTHNIHFENTKPAYFREFGDAVGRNFYNELHAFLEHILVEAPPKPDPNAVAPAEGSEKSA